MQSSLSQSQLEQNDELDIRNNQDIRNNFEADEKILFSGMVVKINKDLKAQDRILVITSKALYNIKPDDNLVSKLAHWLKPQLAIKRKLPLKKITSLTINLDDGFVVHAKEEYDYQYSSAKKREKIFKLLGLALFKAGASKIPLFITEEKNLARYTTTEEDLKAGKDKRPDIKGHINVDKTMYEKGLMWIIQNYQSLLSYSVVDPNHLAISRPVNQSQAQSTINVNDHIPKSNPIVNQINPLVNNPNVIQKNEPKIVNMPIINGIPPNLIPTISLFPNNVVIKSGLDSLEWDQARLNFKSLAQQSNQNIQANQFGNSNINTNQNIPNTSINSTGNNIINSNLGGNVSKPNPFIANSTIVQNPNQFGQQQFNQQQINYQNPNTNKFGQNNYQNQNINQQGFNQNYQYSQNQNIYGNNSNLQKQPSQTYMSKVDYKSHLPN